MTTALAHKARADLARRRPRTILTIVTLGLAVSSLGLLALPGLMDRTMDREVRATRLHDLAVATRDMTLDAGQIDTLRHLPNVVALDLRVVHPTTVRVGDSQQSALLWGLDLDSQTVDTLDLTDGRVPRRGELLTDAGNDRLLDAPLGPGDQISIPSRARPAERLRVSGTAHSLASSSSPFSGDDAVVFYAAMDTVRDLSGVRGVNHLSFRLADSSADEAARTTTAVRDYLRALTGTQPFVDLPDQRAPGHWPGRDTIGQITSLFSVITVLAVVCAVFLIANTMNTLITEQAAEIAIMKTLGGRRRQIAGVFLRSAAWLGALGGLLGSVLGAVIAAQLTRFFASAIFGVEARFAVSMPVVAVSLLLGPTVSVIACLPALRRALRRPIADVLADPGRAEGFGARHIERILARGRFLPSTFRFGLRNVFSQRRRSMATIAQVAVATATALALLGLGLSVTATLNQVYASFGYDISIGSRAGSLPLDEAARRVVAASPGIAEVDPVLQNSVTFRGSTYPAYGVDTSPLYAHRLRAGRWFNDRDAERSTPAVVLGPAIAESAHARIGGTIALVTASGETEAQVIGIDTGQRENGNAVYFPLPVLQDLTGWRDATNTLWLSTTDHSQGAVDRVALAVEERLSTAGYEVDTQRLYVERASNKAQNDMVVNVIRVLGLLVVAITLTGLVNALTMSIIDRTREIAILRCIGAGARDVRRVFTTEAMLLAAAGGILGLPLGWLLFRALVVFVSRALDVDLSPVFPGSSIPLILAGTLLMTMVVIRPPLRRATLLQPSSALRYQ